MESLWAVEERWEYYAAAERAVNSANLAQSFFGAEVEGHENPYGNSPASVVQLVNAHDFAKRFTVDGARHIRIGMSNEHTHADSIVLVLGGKVYAVDGRVYRRQDLVEVMVLRIRRPHPNDTRELQAPFMSTLYRWTFARHEVAE
jgi:hypothetical protein